jgi:hypothetical protein
MRLDFCVACGRKDGLNQHHVVPRVHSGSDDEFNLITLCRECHGKMHGVEWKIGLADLTKAGQARAVQRGKKLGLPPAVDRMPATVALAKQLYDEGYSFRRIGDELAHRGHFSRKSKPFRASTLQKIVGTDGQRRARGRLPRSHELRRSCGSQLALWLPLPPHRRGIGLGLKPETMASA